MSNVPPPRIQLLLRVFAGKLELDLLDIDEKASISDLLRKLSDGKSVDDIFHVWRPASRPTDPLLEQRLYDMAITRLPVKLGGEGQSYKATISLIAERYNKSIETVKADFKSEKYKEISDLVMRDGELAASLGIAEKWQGGKSTK